MPGQELHLTEHETLRKYSDVFVLAVGPKPARPAIQLALRAVGLADR
jgi:hypothetical protein